MGTFIAIGEKVIAEAEHLSAEVLSEIEKVGQEALEKVKSLIEAHKAAGKVTTVPNSHPEDGGPAQVAFEDQTQGNDTASASEAQTSTDTASPSVAETSAAASGSST